MASMVIEEPAFACRVSPSDRFEVETKGRANEYEEQIVRYLEDLRRELGGKGARVEIDNPVPPHSGFGSKTNTLLSIGKGYSRAYDIEVTTDRLAEIAGRAGTSGGTVNLIDRGGFLVDGGHATPDDFRNNPNKYLIPSRYAGPGKRPPVLITAPFPAWPVLMILPNGNHIHGSAELEFFQTVLPIPIAESQRTAHIVLMNLAPAVVEEDYAAFCNALNAITFESYFKRRQIEAQNANVAHVLNNARDNGIDAIGMSSMGPVCFSFTRATKRVADWLDALVAKDVVKTYWVTRVANHPAMIR